MANERPFNQKPKEPPRAFPDPEQLDLICKKLQQAKKPVFIGGHGIWWTKAETALSKVASAISIPIFNVPYHQKLLSETNPCYMGLADFHQYSPSKYAIHNSDCIIMIGGRSIRFEYPAGHPMTIRRRSSRSDFITILKCK